jgi:spermidine/putrescine-binding protein
MSEPPSPDQRPDPPPARPQRAPRPTRGEIALILASRRTTRRAALALSAVLVATWAGYVALAPAPVDKSLSGAPAEPATPAVSRDAVPGAEPDEAAVVRLAAPAGLIDAALVQDFVARTGRAVEVTDLGDGSGDIDPDRVARAAVVIAAGPAILDLVLAGRLKVLPLHRVPAAARLDPGMTARAAVYDPERFHALPYAWEIIGIGYDRAAVLARLGPAAEVDSWSILFDPASAAKLAGCGLQTLDAPDTAFPAALAYLGRDPAGAGVADMEAAAAAWDAVKGFFARFDSADIGANLAAATVCAAVAPSGQVYQARAAARAAAVEPGPRPDIAFAVPREGALLRMYLLAMPAAARSDPAAALIDYLLQPEVAARMTNQRWIANAVPRSRAFLRPEIQQDNIIYPDAAVMARLSAEPRRSVNAAGLSQRLWRLINASTRAP